VSRENRALGAIQDEPEEGVSTEVRPGALTIFFSGPPIHRCNHRPEFCFSLEFKLSH